MRTAAVAGVVARQKSDGRLRRPRQTHADSCVAALATIAAAAQCSGPTSNVMTQSEPPREGSEARQVLPQCAAMVAKYDAIVAAFAHGGVKEEAVLEFR